MTNGYLSETLLDQLEISDCDKLMIVAHPDDETLWGGEHLVLEGGYFILCMTRGYDLRRHCEFNKAIDASNQNKGLKKNIGCILPYYDNRQREFEDEEASGFAKDIELLLGYKKWDKVITHNPDGEYGHWQHKLLCRVTTDIFESNNNLNKESLYYFGQYFSKKKMADALTQGEIAIMREDSLQNKMKLVEVYVSQRKTIIKNMGHMIAHEHWDQCSDMR